MLFDLLFLFCMYYLIKRTRVCLMMQLAGASHAHQGFTEGQRVSLSGRLEVFLLFYNPGMLN